MEERNRLAASRWNVLSKEGKTKFEDVAKRYKHPDVSELSQDERERLIARHRRQLLAEVCNVLHFLTYLPSHPPTYQPTYLPS